jgi:hypothetical protein
VTGVRAGDVRVVAGAPAPRPAGRELARILARVDPPLRAPRIH